nr:glycosyltransferase family A protein [uncultured Friedmanniella sp.]
MTCIIIVYNGESYLDEAIWSVRRQSFKAWELVIVDDGSSDGSQEIARRHVAADHRIRLRQHADRRNHGMSATRNLGLSESRGHFVGFLDADDVWEPVKIAEQVDVLTQHPEAAMVYGRTLIWHSWETGAGGDDYYFDLGVPSNRVHRPPVLFRQLLQNRYQTPTTCNALMRRSAIEQVGGFEESFPAMFEDQVFFAKVLLRFPVFVSDRSWARYRQHARSASAAAAAEGAEGLEHIRFLRWLHRYISQERGRTAPESLWVAGTMANLSSRRLMRRARRRLRGVRRRSW